MISSFCEHVYKESQTEICSLCNQWTHKTDWEQIHRLHREWISSGKATAQGWWSI